MSTTAIVTGANQGLGRALVAGVARRLGAAGNVYLTGRDANRVAAKRDGRFIAAVCPGLVDTDASRPWFADMSQAQSPDAAADDILALALDPIDSTLYGELLQHGRVLPWS